MLNKQELVNFINEKLNLIDTNYKFNIVAEVGETKAGCLSGILLTNELNTPNIPNYNEVNYSFTVAILVPSARTNENYIKVDEIVSQFIDTYDATEQTFDGVATTLAMTPGKPETLKTDFEVGNNVPLYFTIKGLWGNNITSTKKRWFINNLIADKPNDFVEIPFENEGIYLQKDGRTNKIQGVYNTQTLPTGVTKQYKFTFPYSSDFAVLQQDIFGGNFKKIYTLKYYDGVSYTAETPFTTKVSLFATGDNNSARTRTAKFNVTFTDVDDGNTEVKYWLALIDNPFDDQTEDTRWFNSQEEQQAYYEEKVTNGCRYEQILAPNLNSVYITSQVYENTQGYDMLSVVNKNYAVIKITEPDTSTTPASTKSRYLYYYIKNSQIGANNQYLFDLKLDSLQTYLFDPDIKFSDCFIEKSNLNRWKKREYWNFVKLTTKPDDWDTNYTDYYLQDSETGAYIKNGSTKFEPFFMCKFNDIPPTYTVAPDVNSSTTGIYYVLSNGEYTSVILPYGYVSGETYYTRTVNSFYEMLTKQPDDWETNYGNYYYITRINPVTSTSTPFVAGAYFTISHGEFKVYYEEPTDWDAEISSGVVSWISATRKNSIATFTSGRFYSFNHHFSNTVVEFDAGINSKLFTREDIQNVPKRMTNRKNIGMTYFPNKSAEINKWFNDNILCWIYYYLDPAHNYKYNNSGVSLESPLPQLYNEQFEQNIGFTGGQTSVSNSEKLNNTTIQSNTVCICAPIYKCYTNSISDGNNDVEYTVYHRIYANGYPLENDAVADFLYHNGGETGTNAYVWGSPYLIGTKISYCHPFSLEGPDCHINDNGDLVLDTINVTEQIATQGGASPTQVIPYLSDWTARVLNSTMSNNNYDCFLNFVKHAPNTYCEQYTVQDQFQFNINEIVGADKNIKFNPKLLGTDFKEIRISDQNEDGFVYDAQKLNLKTLTPIASGSLTPDLSKIYLRFQIPEDNVYNEQSSQNLTGYVGTDDNSIILANSQYATMLANTKNFYNQNASDRGFALMNSLIGALGMGANTAIGMKTAGTSAELAKMSAKTAGSAASIGAGAAVGAAGMAAGFAVNAVGQAASAGMNYIQSKMNEQFMVDNLKNAPASVSNAKGNIVFNNMYTKLGAIIEEWDALPKDKETANDYMVRYGYNTNLIGNPFDYLNTSGVNGRHYFNYIKAQIQNISGISISNTIRTDIRERFDNGVRFWNSDTVDYTKENYEQWLNPIQISRVVLNKTRLEYNGELQEIEVVAVYDVNNRVVPKNSYTVSGTTEAINTGTYTVTVKGEGICKGTVNTTWEIYENET